MCVRPGTSVGSHKHSDKHSCSKRRREFVNCLRTTESARTTPFHGMSWCVVLLSLSLSTYLKFKYDLNAFYYIRMGTAFLNFTIANVTKC